MLVELLLGNVDWVGAQSAGFSPLFVVGLGMFVLSQVTKMSHICLVWSAIFLLCEVVLDTLRIQVPVVAVQALFVVVLAVHVPMMNKKQSYGLIGFVALVSGGTVMDEMDNVKVFLCFVAFVMFVHRAVLTIVTLAASTPTPLFFSFVSHIMPRWEFGEKQFFRTDNPPEEIAAKRERAFNDLYDKWIKKYPKSMQTSQYLADKFSDLRFAAGSRVFIPYQKKLESWCDPCTVIDKVDRTDLIDVDGHRLTDVSGSYGVNVCGYDEYKRFIQEGWDLVKDVGCVLGPLHPLIRENIDMLRQISKKDEISFHMSGTEAVMCATRLVRFNTRKKFIVLFGGSYHGWWDGVQPMAGNERVPTDILTLKDMNPLSMTVIKMRAHEIAAVVINPLQAFHPNQPPPSDLVLASNTRGASDSTVAYQKWLLELRKVCTELGIVLIFDEVYTGFRLAPGGAQEYFGVTADMVVYGKTLGGGIANGIVCGPRHLMTRSDRMKPLRVAYVIGTFAAHPLLVGSMNRFLKWATSKEARQQYDQLRSTVKEWVEDCNARLEKEFPKSTAPIAIAAYASVWTILYKRPGRYHWLLQYYLKDEGLNLSWVGTGRLSLSLDFTRQDLDLITEKLIRASHRMENDGWWWVDQGKSPSKAIIQFNLVSEIVKALVKRVFTFQ